MCILVGNELVHVGLMSGCVWVSLGVLGGLIRYFGVSLIVIMVIVIIIVIIVLMMFFHLFELSYGFLGIY